MLSELTNDVCWDNITNELNTHTACTILYKALYSMFDHAVPKTAVNRSRKQYPPWFSPELIKAIKKKDNIRKSMHTRNISLLRKKYSDQRALVKYYILLIEDNLRDDPRKFWRFTTNKKGQSRIPGTLHNNNVTFNSPQKIVNEFANYFESVYRQAAHPGNNPKLNISKITEGDYTTCIKQSK